MEMTKKSLEERVEELEDFKTRIELGSSWLRCSFYVMGSFAVFAISFYEFVIKHIIFK